MNKNNKNVKVKERYFGEITLLRDGRFKFRRVKKLVTLNQFKRAWKNVNSRSFSRKVNKSELVTH